MWLFLLFLLVPLIEIALFIQVGGWIGLWPTLAIVVATAIAGTVLVRSQGAQALDRLRRSFNDLEDPTDPLAHGAMILFSGALLLTPGFFTDAVGFALLLPPVRVALLNQLKNRVRIQTFGTRPRHGPYHPRDGGQGGRGDNIIDADYEVEGDTPRHNGPSGWTRH